MDLYGNADLSCPKAISRLFSLFFRMVKRQDVPTHTMSYAVFLKYQDVLQHIWLHFTVRLAIHDPQSFAEHLYDQDGQSSQWYFPIACTHETVRAFFLKKVAAILIRRSKDKVLHLDSDYSFCVFKTLNNCLTAYCNLYQTTRRK